jgi:hypothetical protein
MSTVSSRFGKSIIYGVAITPLLVTLGFYFIEHVPDREEYFVNLRFRTLAVIGKQIETKLESVSSGLTYGKLIEKVPQSRPSEGAQIIPFDQYVQKVFPDLTPVDLPSEVEDAKLGGPDIDFGFVRSGGRLRFRVNRQEMWEGSLARLIRPFTEDASFDDILLATVEGAVLFQRSNATPKINDVAAILKKQEAKEPGPLEVFHRLASEGSGNDTDLLKQVDLDGSSFHLFAEPLTIQVDKSLDRKPKDLLLCGLVHSERVRQESMHVPPKYLLWIIVPLIAGLLSGPFLKLVLLRRTGRFETRDLPLLAMFSCLAMAMLTVVLLAYRQYDENRERLGLELADLAGRLDGQLLAGFRDGRRLLQQIDEYARRTGPGASAANAGYRVGLWSDKKLRESVPGIEKSDLEFVFWTDADGRQIEKWTPLETNTAPYPQTNSEHFELAATGQYWRDQIDPTAALFTSELRISPTTSAPITVLTIPSQRIVPTVPPRRTPYISLVVTPRPLLSPVIPPETGYAVVRNDGSVLYHSKGERILNENLFRETEDSRELENAVASQSEKCLQANYRGSDVMFCVRPIRDIAGIPWTVVAFREMEPWQSLGWQVALDVLVVYLVLWIGPALIWMAVLLRFKFQKYPWSRCRIEVLRYFWPRKEASGNYLAVFRTECVILIAFLALLIWFNAQPDGTAGMVLLLAAFLLPLIAMADWAWKLRCPTGRRAPKRWRRSYVAALCLGMVIASVLPVTAFFHLGLYLENQIHLRSWQEELAGRVASHRRAEQAGMARLSKNRNTASQTMDTAAKPAAPLPPRPNGACDDEQLYQALYRTTVTCQGKPAQQANAVWMEVLRLFRTEAPGGLDAGNYSTSRAPDAPRRERPEHATPPSLGTATGDLAAPVVVKSELGILPTPLRQASWWALMFLLLAAGCAWVWNAASRLFLFDFYEIPLRSLKTLPKAKDLDHSILVLGLPRSGKDGAVKAYVGYRAETIDLKVEKLDEAWLHQTLARLHVRLEPESAVQSAPASLVAAAGSTAGGFPAPVPAGSSSDTPKTPDWIHITNLESALHEKGPRDVVLRLIDALLRCPEKPRLVVTSVVDPVFHLDSIFPEQRKEVARDPLPETEFGRWAHVLLQFERVTTGEELPAPHWAGKVWGKKLWEEARHHRWLLRIANLIAEEIQHREEHGPGVPSDTELIEELHEKALALYELFWSACTRPEKLMLVQLAQTGLVNPLAKDTLHELIRKHLVVMGTYPKIMNESFTRFLNTAANAGQIEAWEKEAGESPWPVVRNVLLIVVVFAMAMIGVSQNHALQAFSALLTAVAGALGGSFKLADLVAQRFAKGGAALPG